MKQTTHSRQARSLASRGKSLAGERDYADHAVWANARPKSEIVAARIEEATRQADLFIETPAKKPRQEAFL